MENRRPVHVFLLIDEPMNNLEKPLSEEKENYLYLDVSLQTLLSVLRESGGTILRLIF
jgi:hypothetical protein